MTPAGYAFTRQDLETAATRVAHEIGETPTRNWPLLSRRAGADVFVKHENHTPIGAFKVRGGIIYLDEILKDQPAGTLKGVITATRGNHGQSIARAATAAGIASTIVVPHGNSVEKNRAMTAFGARLIEFGKDFDEAKDEAVRLAGAESLHMVPAFHPALVKGVASYAMEFFRDAADLDAVYVPIGMGSGICGVMAARDCLGLRTEIIGVVAEAAPAVALSFAAGHPVPTNTAATFADGMACRVPNPDSVALILKGAADVIRVSEDEIAEAVRHIYEDTHNIAEGAGAAAFAALMKDRRRKSGKRLGIILSGGNVDRPVYAEILADRTPRP